MCAGRLPARAKGLGSPLDYEQTWGKHVGDLSDWPHISLVFYTLYMLDLQLEQSKGGR